MKLLLAAVLLAASVAHAQTKQVRIIVGAPPGGANDTVARIIANRMDGATLLIASQTILAVGPVINHVKTFDPLKDFAAVTLIGSTPLMLVVHPDVPAKNVKELVALAKAKPGEINFGSGGIGTPGHRRRHPGRRHRPPGPRGAPRHGAARRARAPDRTEPDAVRQHDRAIRRPYPRRTREMGKTDPRSGHQGRLVLVSEEEIA
jgi:tripartite-type tricarboxylate transporter receptor subunit TctC